MEEDEQLSCFGCNTCLMEPFIKCAECTSPTVYICLQCFARGLEKEQHESYHGYEVIVGLLIFRSLTCLFKASVLTIDISQAKKTNVKTLFIQNFTIQFCIIIEIQMFKIALRCYISFGTCI